MKARLDDKVAIITGGAHGMGAATCRLFAGRGAKVVVADIDRAAGEALARELGPDAVFQPLDVTSEADWQAAVAASLARFGRIDILVNNAGMLAFTSIETLDPAEAARLLAVNVIGPMLGVKHVSAAMLPKGRGAIVNISSVDGLRGCNGTSAYVASKWAVRGLTKAQALELGPRGIRVNSVHPGGIDTRMANPFGLVGDALQKDYQRVPLQRIGLPEEVAEASAFLASDAASYISGAELAVDGGWMAGNYQPMLAGAPASIAEVAE